MSNIVLLKGKLIVKDLYRLFESNTMITFIDFGLLIIPLKEQHVPIITKVKA